MLEAAAWKTALDQETVSSLLTRLTLERITLLHTTIVDSCIPVCIVCSTAWLAFEGTGRETKDYLISWTLAKWWVDLAKHDRFILWCCPGSYRLCRDTPLDELQFIVHSLYNDGIRSVLHMMFAHLLQSSLLDRIRIASSTSLPLPTIKRSRHWRHGMSARIKGIASNRDTVHRSRPPACR